MKKDVILKYILALLYCKKKMSLMHLKYSLLVASKYINELREALSN